MARRRRTLAFRYDTVLPHALLLAAFRLLLAVRLRLAALLGRRRQLAAAAETQGGWQGLRRLAGGWPLLCQEAPRAGSPQQSHYWRCSQNEIFAPLRAAHQPVWRCLQVHATCPVRLEGRQVDWGKLSPEDLATNPTPKRQGANQKPCSVRRAHEGGRALNMLVCMTMASVD